MFSLSTDLCSQLSTHFLSYCAYRCSNAWNLQLHQIITCTHITECAFSCTEKQKCSFDYNTEHVRSKMPSEAGQRLWFLSGVMEETAGNRKEHLHLSKLTAFPGTLRRVICCAFCELSAMHKSRNKATFILKFNFPGGQNVPYSSFAVVSRWIPSSVRCAAQSVKNLVPPGLVMNILGVFWYLRLRSEYSYCTFFSCIINQWIPALCVGGGKSQIIWDWGLEQYALKLTTVVEVGLRNTIRMFGFS